MSPYYIGTVLNNALLLIISSSAASLVLSVGEFNLGGEGQIYAGGFAGAIALHTTRNLASPLSFIISLIVAMLVPCAMTALSSILKQFKNASILLTSFLISAASIPFIDSCIAGPFRGSANNLLATHFVKESLRSPKILSPSPLSAVALISPVFCILLWFVLNKTSLGKKLQITGISNEFAEYCGYNISSIISGSLCVSGALYGLTGFIAVIGTYYTCHSGFYVGMGWNSLSCALIARSHPLLLMPTSLLLSWIFTSADRIALFNNFGFDISSLIQGVVLVLVSISYAKKMKVPKIITKIFEKTFKKLYINGRHT